MKRVAGFSPAIMAAIFLTSAAGASAQELDPGAYTVSPVGVNVATLGFLFNTGDVTFDQALPAEDVSARIGTMALAYGRALGLWGRSSTLLVSLPIMKGKLTGRYLGQPTEVNRIGLGDARVRIGVNLYGARARRLPEFAKVPPAPTNLSVSLTVVAPVGQYDPARLVNLGSNRWAFKPEGAIVRNHGRWTIEAYAGVWLFATNHDFYNGRERSQDPLFSSQAFLRYSFKPGLWLSVNGNYYSGGQTTVDGQVNLDFQRNSRLGTTLAVPLSRRHAIRVAASQGAYTTIGSDFFSLSFSFQRAWGGGM